MDTVTLTTQQIETIACKPGLFARSQGVFEILIRCDEMVDMYGLHYMGGDMLDVLDNQQYRFEVLDNKKWVLTRLKYGI